MGMTNERKITLRLFLILSVGILFLIYCSTISREKKGSIEKKTFVIGYMKNIFFNVDVNDVQASLKVWVDENIKHYKGAENYNFVSKFYGNSDELEESIRSENIAVISMSTYDFLNNKDKLNLEPKLVPEIGGKPGVEFCLLVRKKSNFHNVSDLKEKNIGLISTPVFIASSIWLDVLLFKNNLKPREKYFNKIETAQKESQLILSLFFNDLDACIVTKTSFDLMKELNPQIGQEIESILNSPLYSTGLLCYAKSNQNKGIREKFYESLIELYKSNVGKQIFTILKINKLIPSKNEYFDSFVELLKDYRKINSQNAKKNIK